MKIAVTASGPGLEAAVDPRFGRCPYLVVVDDQTGEHTALRNPGLEMASGAGIATAEALVNEGVQVVLTGNCGPKAYQVLAAAGVQVVNGVEGTVEEAVEAYRAGKLQPSSGPSVGAHFGRGGFGWGGPPMGPGAGRGYSGG